MKSANHDLKLPPCNYEAEQAVLGAVLLDNQALPKALDLIGLGDYYRPAHRRIFEAMIALSKQNQVIDLVTLTDYLRHRGSLEAVGGSSYLTDLAQSVATAASVKYHAKIVQRDARRRHAIEICQGALDQFRNGDAEVDRVTETVKAGFSKLQSLPSERSYEPNPASVFHPIDVGVLLEEPEDEIAWVVDGFGAPGCFTLLAGTPKVGKTTLVYDLIVDVAVGRPWLGRIVRQANVLVLAVEEHRRDVVRRFWAADNDNLAGRIKIASGPLPFTEGLLREIVAYVQSEAIGLVLVDTLPSWLDLDDENSASEVLRAGGLLLKAIRQTQAAWICLAHTRKSGGDFGQEVRGSSALLGLVDISLSLKRTDTPGTQRVLEAVSRYNATPPKLVIGLGDHGYEALGTPEEVGLTAKIEKLRAALTETGQTVKELMATTGLSKQDVSKCLVRLGEPTVREGTGHKNSPFTYRRHSLCRTSNPRGLTCDESNSGQGIRCVSPPIPCDESNTAIQEEVLIDAD